jgi:hypothetical protein
MENSSVTITSSMISGNKGGGLGADSNSQLVVANGTKLLSNEVAMDSAAAVIAYGSSSVVLAEGVEVSGNIAHGLSGGALAALDNAVITLAGPGILLRNNTSKGANGGAVTLAGSSKLVIVNNAANVTKTPETGHSLPGVSASGSSMEVVVFEGNVAVDRREWWCYSCCRI